jgi:hypothetical protein
VEQVRFDLADAGADVAALERMRNAPANRLPHFGNAIGRNAGEHGFEMS